ncbi:MAG: hypothetical protein WBA10_12490, partial [Elainellaceae cyanobacterium]
VYDDEGRLETVPDSLWIIEYGEKGIVGLASMMSIFLLPPLLVLTWRCPPKLWQKPEYAPLAALSMAVMMYTIDCLLNAMLNPIYILACGGLAGIALHPVAAPSKQPKALRKPALPSEAYSQQT